MWNNLLLRWLLTVQLDLSPPVEVILQSFGEALTLISHSLSFTPERCNIIIYTYILSRLKWYLHFHC